MSAKIETLIDKQDSFEIIRDEIAAILLIEKENQKTLAKEVGKDKDLWDFDVYTERSLPWELIEDADGKIIKQVPLVNVFFDQFAPNDQASNTVDRQLNTGQFQIDCVSAKNTKRLQNRSLVSGDELAARDAQRILKLVRNILMSSVYTYLGLRGVVTKRMIQSATIFQPNINDKPAQRVMVARIQLNVEYYEFSPQAIPVELELVSAQCTRAEDGLIYFENDFDYTT